MSDILRRVEAGEIDPNDLFLAIKDKIDPALMEEVFADPDPDRDDRADIEMELYNEFYRDDERFSF